MNKTLEQFAREEILKGLQECTPAQQTMFRRLYCLDSPEAELVNVVKALPTEKLDWALTQIERTLETNSNNG